MNRSYSLKNNIKFFRVSVAAILVFACQASFGQNKAERKYNERAAEIEEEVWGNSPKAFAVSQIPDAHKNESAVIIAKSYEVTNSNKMKFKMTGIFGGAVRQFRYYTTFHERVILQDKSALEKYSTINYKKMLNNSRAFGFTKLKNTYETFIGAKVLKPNGKISKVNAGEEEVLTKDTDKSKEGKLAIPDLAQGDILDYYVRVEEVVEAEGGERGPDLFFLREEYPVMYYNIKYSLDKKSGADIASINGAKSFSVSTDEDKDLVLELTEKDIPKIKGNIWTSQFRQLPYVVIRYGFPGSRIKAARGEAKSGPFTSTCKTDLLNYYAFYTYAGYQQKAMEEHFGGKKSIAGLPADSIVNYIYNYTRYESYGSFGDLDVSNSRNYNDMETFKNAIYFSKFLDKNKIDNDVIISGNRFGGRLEDAFSAGDFEVLVKVKGDGKLQWFSFKDIFLDAGMLHSGHEGEKGTDLFYDRKSKKVKAETVPDVKLPVAPHTANTSAETIGVTFNKDNQQLITINRTCRGTGQMKISDQKRLLLAEQVHNELAKMLSIKTTAEYLDDSKKGRAKGEELQTAFAQERPKQKDYFLGEIKAQYEQEPKELLSYKIINSGLSISKPVLEYNQVFTMENFVKKAGNNYIFNIGQLMGDYKKVEEKDRTRALDVYMPYARTLSYKISVEIPEGYKVKGVEELNKNVKNDAASFSSVASLSGNTVNLEITRIYFHHFEPAANWPKLLEAMDAAAEFTSAKILLEKQK